MVGLPPPTPADTGAERSHAPATPPPPSATSLLSSLLALDFNLHALREKERLSDAEVTAFLADPGTRVALANLRASLDIIDHLQNRARRRRAIDALVEVIDATADLVEKRKAATTLLRQTAHAPAGSPPRATRATAGSPARAEASSPHPADALDLGPEVTPPRPNPSSRPDADPETLLARVSRAFYYSGDSPDPALNVLHRAMAPEARLNSRPAPREPAAFRAFARAELRPILNAVALVPVGGRGTEFTHTEDAYALAPSGQTTLVSFDFAAVLPNRWRITAISLGDPDTS